MKYHLSSYSFNQIPSAAFLKLIVRDSECSKVLETKLNKSSTFLILSLTYCSLSQSFLMPHWISRHQMLKVKRWDPSLGLFNDRVNLNRDCEKKVNRKIQFLGTLTNIPVTSSSSLQQVLPHAQSYGWATIYSMSIYLAKRRIRFLETPTWREKVYFERMIVVRVNLW